MTLLEDPLVPTTLAPLALSPATPTLLPLDAGEQYRFTFDMGACVGCHSCEVACAEQNDLPVTVAWRKVGELEAGEFPKTRRFSLSMACNHCLEPTCLSGCPTEAYTKLANGIVQHHPDECIGCQYCIWNCPYEVPVFDHTRKIVSKCDMCLPRLEVGQAPACVGACPTKAIGVEKVNVAAWRDDHAEADAPGLPPALITLSTTRVRLPDTDLPGRLVAVDDERFVPEDPHWPLIALTLLTQVALGTVAATVATQLATGAGWGTLAGGAMAAFLAGAVALVASLLHLGKPIRALKALRNVRTSWLSREVALFAAFSGLSLLYAGWGLAPALGVAATAAGVAGVYASGRLYLVPARPVWNSGRTLVAFFATALAVGPRLALVCLDRGAISRSWSLVLLGAAAAGTLTQLGVGAHLRRAVNARGADRQHRGTAHLLRERFRAIDLLRVGLGLAGLALVASAAAVPVGGAMAQGRLILGLVVTAASELIGRYLFYVTVVPFRVAGGFVSRRS